MFCIETVTFHHLNNIHIEKKKENPTQWGFSSMMNYTLDTPSFQPSF